MSERIWARPIPTKGAGHVPAHEQRATTGWTVGVRRKGRVLTVTLTAPSTLIAALAAVDLELAARQFARRYTERPP